MITEMFKIHEEDKDKIKPGMILSVDKENQEYHVLADKENTCVVGVVSEDSVYYVDGNDYVFGVPVVLAGRVKVKIDSKYSFIPKLGSWIEACCSDILGYGVCSLSSTRDTRNGCVVGKVVKLIDENIVEILVSLH